MQSTLVYASKPIAKIVSFEGEVLIQNGSTINKVLQKNQNINQGDLIQTKQGKAKIVFTDGSIIKINPFSNISLVEREEETKNFLFFNSKQLVRRMTCFLGKFWFKSGASDIKNKLQTPTAVCGIRGSDGDLGYDNINTYLIMYTGSTQNIGKVKIGRFSNPGFKAAKNNDIYKAMSLAYKNHEQAVTQKNTINVAQSKVLALKVIKQASVELKKNPDEIVKKKAEVASYAVESFIQSAKSKVILEELKVAETQIKEELKVAKESNNQEIIKKSQIKIKEINEALLKTEEIVKKSEENVAEAKIAIENNDVNKAIESAKESKTLEKETKIIDKKIKEKNIILPTPVIAPTPVITPMPIVTPTPVSPGLQPEGTSVLENEEDGSGKKVEVISTQQRSLKAEDELKSENAENKDKNASENNEKNLKTEDQLKYEGELKPRNQVIPENQNKPEDENKLKEEIKPEHKQEKETKEKNKVKSEDNPKPKDEKNLKQEIKPESKKENKSEPKEEKKSEPKKENKVKSEDNPKPKDEKNLKQEIKPEPKKENRPEHKEEKKTEHKQENEPKEKNKVKSEDNPEPKDEKNLKQEKKTEPKKKNKLTTTSTVTTTIRYKKHTSMSTSTSSTTSSTTLESTTTSMPTTTIPPTTTSTSTSSTSSTTTKTTISPSQ